MRKFVYWLILLCVCVWLGAIVYFSFVVAPAAFGVLPSIDLAGRLVNRALGSLHVLGLVCGIVLLACTFLIELRVSRSVRALALLMILFTAISQFGITPQMERIRNAVGGSIQALPKQDAGRAAFDRLHTMSVALEGLVLLGGLSLLGVLAAEQDAKAHL